MEQLDDVKTMLGHISAPAFLAQNGIIIEANASATHHMVTNGTKIEDILPHGVEEYQKFQKGSLFLSICIHGTVYSCTVTQLQNYQLFTLEENENREQLQAFALAAQQLSIPISDIYLIASRLSGASEEDKSVIMQNLSRLQRIIGNMSDAGKHLIPAEQMSTHELCSVFEEALEKATALLLHSGIILQYSLPQHQIFSLAEPEILKRAIYNLLSNAAKFASANSSIHAELKQVQNRLYFTVTNQHDTKCPIPGDLFHRYMRSPGLENPKHGVGLGIAIVQAAALAHNGTVLVEQPDSQGLRITMSLAIRKAKGNTVRSAILKPDLYGGQDQALIELADVLPHHLYKD